MAETEKQRRARAARIVRSLRQLYPDADCALDHSNPLELLVATILSAQCTDERVNQVTPTLFRSDRHQGRVPETMEELVELPGVGRKTANVILGTWFGLPAVTVDTHVKRLAGRLGLTTHEDPVKIEFDLQDVFPEKDWTLTSHALIWHGRRVCKARTPRCDDCALNRDCPYPSK
jgi:endonuclease-3